MSSWFKMNDDCFADDSLLNLSPSEFRLLTFSKGFAHRFQTDGHISRNNLKTIRGTFKQAMSLVEAGFWVEEGNGWTIANYLKTQQSKAQSVASAEANRARQQEHRDRQRNGVTIPPKSKSKSKSKSNRLGEPALPPLPDDKKPGPSPKARGARTVPDDWTLTPELKVKLDAKGYPPGLAEREAEKFRLHEFKTPKLNFDLAFQAWMARAAEYAQASPAPMLTLDPRAELERSRQRMQSLREA